MAPETPPGLALASYLPLSFYLYPSVPEASHSSHCEQLVLSRAHHVLTHLQVLHKLFVLVSRRAFPSLFEGMWSVLSFETQLRCHLPWEASP